MQVFALLGNQPVDAAADENRIADAPAGFDEELEVAIQEEASSPETTESEQKPAPLAPQQTAFEPINGTKVFARAFAQPFSSLRDTDRTRNSPQAAQPGTDDIPVASASDAETSSDILTGGSDRPARASLGSTLDGALDDLFKSPAEPRQPVGTGASPVKDSALGLDKDMFRQFGARPANASEPGMSTREMVEALRPLFVENGSAEAGAVDTSQIELPEGTELRDLLMKKPSPGSEFKRSENLAKPEVRAGEPGDAPTANLASAARTEREPDDGTKPRVGTAGGGDPDEISKIGPTASEEPTGEFEDSRNGQRGNRTLEAADPTRIRGSVDADGPAFTIDPGKIQPVPFLNGGSHSIDSDRIGSAIAQRVRQMEDSGRAQTFSIRLDPPELGSILIKVSGTAARVNAEISSNNEGLRQGLESSRNDLIAAVESRGASVESLTVRGENNSGLSGQSQQGNGQGQDPAANPRNSAPSSTAQASQARPDQQPHSATSSNPGELDLTI